MTSDLDPVALERGRMQQVSTGQAPQFGIFTDAVVYVTLQELATRISHRNTGKLIDDPAGVEVMNRVAADENLHFLFYRDLASAAIELAPSTMVMAIERIVRGFAMPGTGITDFDAQEAVLEDALVLTTSKAAIEELGAGGDKLADSEPMDHGMALLRSASSGPRRLSVPRPGY